MDYNILPTFKKPLKSKTIEPHFDYLYLEQAQEAFNDKDYEEAVLCILKHINDEKCVEKKVIQTLKLSINQEKCKINIKVKDDIFYIKASLVQIMPETNKVALFRKVAELNFSTLLIPQIKLEDDRLKIKYSCPLNLITPHKLYNAISNTVINGSYILNMFEDKYNAKAYDETNISPLKKEDFDTAYKDIKDLFKQHEEYENIFKNSRYVNYQWDNTVITMYKIVNMPYVNGYIINEIYENISMMCNERIDLNTRIEKGNSFIRKLAKKDISKYIYDVERFMTLKYNFFVSEIQNRLKNDEDTLKKFMNEKNYLQVSYITQLIFLRLDYDFVLNDTYKTFIYSTLEDISGKKLEYGANKLYDLYKKMLKEKLLSQEDIQEQDKFNERYGLTKDEDKDDKTDYEIENIKKEDNKEKEDKKPKTFFQRFKKFFYYFFIIYLTIKILSLIL